MKVRLATAVAALAIVATLPPVHAQDRPPDAALAAPPPGARRSASTYGPAGNQDGEPAGGPSVQAFPRSCGIQVNTPHPSYTTRYQIHARSESYCSTLPLRSNRVEMWLYRSRWYGWQLRGHTTKRATAPSSSVQRLRTTVVAGCESGDRHRWRAVARGWISTGVQSYTAAAYEQNDDEILCR